MFSAHASDENGLSLSMAPAGDLESVHFCEAFALIQFFCEGKINLEELNLK